MAQPQIQDMVTPVPLAAMPDVNNPAVPLAPLPEVPGETTTITNAENNATETTTTATVMETTTAVPLAPLVDAAVVGPVAQALEDSNNNNATVAGAGMANQSQQPQPQMQQQQMPQMPVIPSECLPFVTGQVLPTNYTGPPAGSVPFGQAPNPNIQYGNPQWQQQPGYNPQQQQWNTVPVEGVQQKASGASMTVASVLVVMAAVAKRFL